MNNPPRKDRIRYKLMPDGHIRAYQHGTPDKRGVSEGNIHLTCAVAPTITTSHEPLILIADEDLSKGLMRCLQRTRTKQ